MNNDKILGNLYEQFDEVSKENALKLKQILDLEDILYSTRILDLEDGSACWCCLPSISGEFSAHDKDCERARNATKHLWRKSNEQKG